MAAGLKYVEDAQTGAVVIVAPIPLPVSIAAPLPVPVSIAAPLPVPVSDAGGSLTVDTPQLPAALVGGRLDENVGAWLGSTAPTVGQKVAAASIPVVLASDQPAIATSDQKAGTSVVTSVATSSAASVTLLAANAARLGATIYNDSPNRLFVKFGTTASSTDYTVRLNSQGYFEVPFDCTSRIDGRLDAGAAAAALVTELTA